MNFKEWLSENQRQPITLQQALGLLQTHSGPISAGEVRTDMLTQHENNQGQFYFDPDFPTNEFGRRGQGWGADRVLGIINATFQKLGLQPVQDLRAVDRNQVAQHAEQIKQMLPPIIVSALPDGSYHLGDGNHRFGVAIVLGLPTLRAIVLE